MDSTYAKSFHGRGADAPATLRCRRAGHDRRAHPQEQAVPYGFVVTANVIAAILGAHATLCKEYGSTVALAVRSAATAEDLPQASFVGQHESYLNVTGSDALLAAASRSLASLFTDRAIHYRLNHGCDLQ